MAQRQFRDDDTDHWNEGYGDGNTNVVKSADETTSLSDATCTGTAASKTLNLGSASSFSNGDIVIIHQSQKATGWGVWELNKISSGGGTTTLTMKYNLMNTYTSGAQIVGFIKCRNFTINTGINVTFAGWDGSKNGIYPIIATQAVNIPGNLNVSGLGFRGATAASYQGEGNVGLGGSNNTAANGNGGGVGNGGAGAGNGLAGSNSGGYAPFGIGGLQVGTANLVIMVFGGGGASCASAGGAWANGGNGSGIVIIIAPIINVTGSINGAGIAGALTSGGDLDRNGSGGGAGMSMLFKGQTINLGSNLVTAPGGPAGGSYKNGSPGGIGSVGRIHADYLTSVSGITTPTIDTAVQKCLNTNSGGAALMAAIG